MFAVPAARSGPHMWVLCGPPLDVGDGTGQSNWSLGTTTNIYVFITAQLFWSTWNALIPSCCHIYCCCQFLKLLLWSGTRWSCCCDLLLWPFCRLWLAYIYLLVIFGTAASSLYMYYISFVVYLYFIDHGYTHVQLHLMTIFLCLRILKCSPLQSTLRTLERSLPCLLCRRSSTK